jgi:L-aminopeptidase/D-esterase-like protein
MAQPGPRNNLTDVSGLVVGHAHDANIRTGTTVILADEPAIAAVCVAGGGPGTRETDLLQAGMLVERVDAIVLSGGSAYGLAAADGVLAALGAQGRGLRLAKDRPGIPPTPIVPAAILYDLANGGDKAWGTQPPYAALGQQALSNCSGTPDLGRVGAGFGARAGGLPGGVGAASLTDLQGLSVGALAAVNSFGSVMMPGTQAFWAWPYELNGEFGGGRPPQDFQMAPDDWGPAKLNPAARQNTTIACIATDAILTQSQAQRVAQMALAGFARAIRPVFAPTDGDVVFVISTGRQALPAPETASLSLLGEAAANTLTRAIARAVWLAREKD